MKQFTKILFFTLTATVFASSMFAQSEETSEARIRISDNAINIGTPSHDSRHNEVVKPHLGVPATKMYVHPATKEQEDMVVKLIKKTSFDENKLDIAKVCLELRPMSSDCIMRIAKVFSFDNTRLTFLKYAYEYCYDKQGYCRKAHKHFSFTSNYMELEHYVEKYNKQHRIHSEVIDKPRPVLHVR